MEEKLREMKKKCPQFIKADLFMATDIFIVVAFVLLLLFIVKKEKIYAAGVGVAVTAAGVSFAAQTLFGKAKVSNNSDNPICVKPENGESVFDVEPRERQYDIDGIKINGKVYKIGDGCHAVVTKEGFLKISSFAGRFMNKVVGGVLTSPPDESWNKLFDC